MNNHKQQALDALYSICRICRVPETLRDTIKQFIESVESVNMAEKKKDILEQFKADAWDAMKQGGLVSLLSDILDDIIPDTLSTSCRYDELRSQLEAERAAHAETKKELEQLGNDYRMQRRELFKEQSAHAETREQLELSQQAETRALQGWHEEQTKSDELPTKAELLAELETLLRKLNSYLHGNIYITDHPSKIMLSYCDEKGRFSLNLGMVKYKPEPVAPADGEPVMVRWCSPSPEDGATIITK